MIDSEDPLDRLLHQQMTHDLKHVLEPCVTGALPSLGSLDCFAVTAESDPDTSPESSALRRQLLQTAGVMARVFAETGRVVGAVRAPGPTAMQIWVRERSAGLRLNDGLEGRVWLHQTDTRAELGLEFEDGRRRAEESHITIFPGRTRSGDEGALVLWNVIGSSLRRKKGPELLRMMDRSSLPFGARDRWQGVRRREIASDPDLLGAALWEAAQTVGPGEFLASRILDRLQPRRSGAADKDLLSLDEHGDDGLALRGPADLETDAVIASDTVQKALRKLTPREREALNHKYQQGLTQTEIARKMELSQQRVSQLLADAHAKVSRELQD